MPRELKPEELRWICPAGECAFENTGDVEPLTTIVGQDRALRAIELGLNIRQPGYNLFISGIPGSGRNTALNTYLDQLAPMLPTPSDWVYVRNFVEEHRPVALELPPGSAAAFATRVEGAIAHAVEDIGRTIESEAHVARREALEKASRAERAGVTEGLDAQAREWGLRIERAGDGLLPIPVSESGELLTPQQFQELPPERRSEIEEHAAELGSRLGQVMLQMRRLDRELLEAVRKLDEETTRAAVDSIFAELAERLELSADSPARRYLSGVERDLVDQIAEIVSLDQPPQAGVPVNLEERRRRFLARYTVNVLVSNTGSGAPVVIENSASYSSLFGRAAYRPAGPVMTTDHTTIQAGSLHTANGGFLVLQAPDIFGEPAIWDALKRALRSQEIRIEALGEQARALPTQTLSPHPIPFTAKVIVVGTPGVYHYAWGIDEDFRKLFKVKADFGPDMERNAESLAHLASFVRRRVDLGKLPPFDQPAIARVIEYATLLAGHQDKLSTRFVDLADIVTEAAYWHDLRNGSPEGHVAREDVARAIEEKRYRASLYEDRMQEMIEDGTIRIRTSGEVVGQVNGLSVYQLADHSFGRPTRITARVSLGEGDFVNIERETEMSGRIHSKAFLSLVGFLQGKYGLDRPLAFTASISFEQVYDEIEGDSASSAELYALLSALADLPIRQGIAATGSVNQLGDVQAVGGVTEKVEGFFDVCAAASLDGSQGVIVPGDNARNLMVKDSVAAAVAEGRFRVWVVDSIDEGIEVLTGVPAGERGADGTFRPDSVHGRAIARIETFLQRQRELQAPPVQPEKRADKKGRKT
ncbi:MAG: AAA family ATPase [Dehalococcoidia bacterium]|nr:AAA family ATPase [Dehalococcoidia bacterium]